MNSTIQKLNSMIPFGNAGRNNTKVANSAMNFGFGNVGANTKPAMNSGSALASASTWNTPLVWFSVLLLVFLGLFAFYYDTFMNSMQNWSDTINSWLTGKSFPKFASAEGAQTAPPSPPQDEDARPSTGMDSVVEKILPPAKDVFTVSKNDYTYYDAAPLCKALGAELATYDQVKRAWQKGADWCNYGWVKGQMAVYPTQNSTYEELQSGPDDQKGACGKPGVNGGYFDNPEMKFGVTCVGKKPAQSQHDANSIAASSTLPLTASGLEFEKKVLRFKEGSDTIGVLPFNKEEWN